MTTLHKAAREALIARDRYGWSPEADAALERLRAALEAVPGEHDAEALRIAGLTLIGLAEHDQGCAVFDLDDEGRHKHCSCCYAYAISVITQAGKTAPNDSAMLAARPSAPTVALTEEQIVGLYVDLNAACHDAPTPTEMFAIIVRAVERAHGIGKEGGA